jgi:hypothetical protein
LMSSAVHPDVPNLLNGRRSINSSRARHRVSPFAQKDQPNEFKSSAPRGAINRGFCRIINNKPRDSNPLCHV